MSKSETTFLPFFTTEELNGNCILLTPTEKYYSIYCVNFNPKHLKDVNIIRYWGGTTEFSLTQILGACSESSWNIKTITNILLIKNNEKWFCEVIGVEK